MGLAEILSIIASIVGCITAVGMVRKAIQWICKKTKKPIQRGPRDFLLSWPDDLVSSDKPIYHGPPRAVKYVPPPGDRNYDPNRDPNRKSPPGNPPPKYGPSGPNQPTECPPPGGPLKS